jgi:phosphoribosylglycinamide formyltransferase-1
MCAIGRVTDTCKKPCRLAVLVSGNGSNLQAIINSIETGVLNAEIVCVISNNSDAFALTRASKHGIAAIVHENCGFITRRDYDTALVAILQKQNVELVVLAGYMRILSDIMVSAYPNAIMNIHPALLPSFPGLHAQQQALDYGVKFTGCTVHFVDCGTDTGPIILQAIVPILQHDTEESLSARIQAEEHRIFPEAVGLYVNQKISVQGRLVLIKK